MQMTDLDPMGVNAPAPADDGTIFGESTCCST